MNNLFKVESRGRMIRAYFEFSANIFRSTVYYLEIVQVLLMSDLNSATNL